MESALKGLEELVEQSSEDEACSEQSDGKLSKKLHGIYTDITKGVREFTRREKIEEDLDRVRKLMLACPDFRLDQRILSELEAMLARRDQYRGQLNIFQGAGTLLEGVEQLERQVQQARAAAQGTFAPPPPPRDIVDDVDEPVMTNEQREAIRRADQPLGAWGPTIPEFFTNTVTRRG